MFFYTESVATGTDVQVQFKIPTQLRQGVIAKRNVVCKGDKYSILWLFL